MGLLVAGREVVLDELSRASPHHLVRLLVELTEQPLPQHLGVAGISEDTGEPLQVVTKRLRDVTVEQRAKGRERASQPPRGHAHPVDRVRCVGTDERVERPHLCRKLGKTCVDDARGGVLAPDLGPRCVRRDAVTQTTSQLRLGHRRLDAVGLEQPGGRFEQRVTPVDELDLELSPRARSRLTPSRVLSRDAIVADLREHMTVGVEQLMSGSMRAYDDDRHEGGATGHGLQDLAERLWHRLRGPAERLVDLEPALLHGQLDVPARVVASGTAAHRDPRCRQGEVTGVEVRRLELVDHRLRDRGDTGKAVEGREVTVVGRGRTWSLSPAERWASPTSTAAR